MFVFSFATRAQNDSCSYCVFWNSSKKLQCVDFQGDLEDFAIGILRNKIYVATRIDTGHHLAKNKKSDFWDGTTEFFSGADIWVDSTNLYAYSRVEIGTDYRLTKDNLIFRARAVFQCLFSFCNCNNEYLDIVLEHEQIQLDICERYCRLLKKTIAKLPKALITEQRIDSMVLEFNDSVSRAQGTFLLESMRSQKVSKTWQIVRLVQASRLDPHKSSVSLDLWGRIYQSLFNQARRLIKQGPSETLGPVETLD
jgi:hypothetical protein